MSDDGVDAVARIPTTVTNDFDKLCHLTISLSTRTASATMVLAHSTV